MVWTEFAESITNRPVAGWCGTIVSGTPGTTLTVNLVNTPALNAWAGVYEFSGTNGCNIRVAAVNNTGTSTTPTSASFTPNYLGYTLLMFADSNSSATFSSGPTNGFTALNIPQAGRGNTAYLVDTLGAVAPISTVVTLSGSVAWDAILDGIEGAASSYSSLPTFVSSTPWIASSNSPAISTVGANLLVMPVQSRHGHTCSPSDSMNGTSWTAGTTYTDTANIDTTDYYILSPHTSLIHTFAVTGSGCITAQNVMAFHRQAAFTAVDGTNGTFAATTNTISTGTVTPSVANDVCVSSIGLGGATISALTNNASFTAPDAATAYVSGTGQPGAQAAYFLNPTSGVGINVGWTWTTNDTWIAANLLCFK